MCSVTTSAAVSIRQLADLTGLTPAFFSLHREELPEAHPVRTNRLGHPTLCYSIADLAEFITRRTGHLSDAECRLRVALMTKSSTASNVRAWRHGLFRLITLANGNHIVVPTDLSSLPKADRVAAQQALDFERARLASTGSSTR
ncbi:hypothetical protein LOY34_14655 [Pseudomonas sp. B21-009]|uniref:hypothetical protein n=1 Tax=Pseudomonas sp. B21-009 TaxID=2895470 RepID=UPI00215F45F3|nr:hypothetical protein [Pseudomonas sp. B21-009]UVM64591.1 hypothetical protein LOY34_14655 [Pseudomonas sp. B21-009]